MNRDLITTALQEIVLRDGKDLKEAQQYLRMRYHIDVEKAVLSRRLKKLHQAEKAVA